MKKEIKIVKENKNGITLIALVITIIVLLILAGVTIVTLTGDNGLITKANESKNTTQQASAMEKVQVEVAGSYGLDGKIDIAELNTNLKRISNLTYNGQTISDDNNVETLPVTVQVDGYYIKIEANGNVKKGMPTVMAGQKAPSDSNAEYTDGKYKAVIPAGYTVSDVEGETSIDAGLVIKKDGNEWVWIPVSSEELAAMYTENETGWTMNGTTGDNAVVTKYKTTGTQTRGNPGTTGWREPDILNNTGYDNKQANWEAAGFSSYIDMATNLRDDYKNMINSVKKYDGFYIGRYELGGTTGEPQEKAGKVMNNTNWYDLYYSCKKFGGDESVVYSRMIWGCQWDQVCKFISTAKDENRDTISLTDSTKYGNYSNSTGDAATDSGSGNFNNTTGRNGAWKTNNIYDLAGNCNEWTQEAGNDNYRAYRGGSYDYGGGNLPVTYRSNCEPNKRFYDLSSRPVIYLK